MIRLTSVALLLLSGTVQSADPVKQPKELTDLPYDVLAFASSHVSEVGRDPAFKGLFESLARTTIDRHFESALGLKLDDFERLKFQRRLRNPSSGPRTPTSSSRSASRSTRTTILTTPCMPTPTTSTANRY